MHYEDKPDYDLLKNLFRTSITRRGYKDADLYDWEKDGNGIENDSLLPSSVPAASQQQPQPVLSSINNKVSAEMTRALMTAQPGGASAALANRQQATEADTLDERWKLSKQTGATSDQSPFSPRRSTQKSLDRTSRRPYTSSGAQASTHTDKDASLSKKQQQAHSRGPLTTTQTENSKEPWRTAALSDLSHRMRRSNTSKSTAGELHTPASKFLGKEDSPGSASHSDSTKPRNAAAAAAALSSAQNRSYQMKPSELAPEPVGDEPPSPAVIMYTSTGSIEHGKPPKTPRSARTTNSRSDALVPVRQMPTRAGDSEAISVPAATFAIKAGPHTVMSQWIPSLDDNFDDECSDHQHSAKWEDAQEKLQR